MTTPLLLSMPKGMKESRTASWHPSTSFIDSSLLHRTFAIGALVPLLPLFSFHRTLSHSLIHSHNSNHLTTP